MYYICADNTDQAQVCFFSRMLPFFFGYCCYYFVILGAAAQHLVKLSENPVELFTHMCLLIICLIMNGEGACNAGLCMMLMLILWSR